MNMFGDLALPVGNESYQAIIIHQGCCHEYFSALACDDVQYVENSLSLTLHSGAITGSLFSLMCKEGYSASSQNGSMICDEIGQWVHKPVCKGRCFHTD